MASLKSLLITSGVAAAAGSASFLISIQRDDLIPVGLAIPFGVLCLAISLVIAVWGLRVYRRRGLWLLLPILPAGVWPLLVLAGISLCAFRGCD